MGTHLSRKPRARSHRLRQSTRRGTWITLSASKCPAAFSMLFAASKASLIAEHRRRIGGRGHHPPWAFLTLGRRRRRYQTA